MTCDCATILANINYYTSAVTYDQSAEAVDHQQTVADETQLAYWQYQKYMCGCTSMMAAVDTAEVTSVTTEDVQCELAKLEFLKKELAGNKIALDEAAATRDALYREKYASEQK